MDRNKDVLIELCPICNRLHTYFLTAGIFDGLGKERIICETPIGEKPDEDDDSEMIPILCSHVVEPNDETNMFIVKRWSFRERQKFYKLVGVFLEKSDVPSIKALKVNLNPKVMDWAILNSTVKSPFPLKEKADLDNEEVDGCILEALYGAIVEWNAPPLAQSSVSQRRFTRTTRASSMRMR